jgi:FPC/CPF motif-containing protein YcgG
MPQMEELLSQFVLDKTFPCVMAKSVIKTGQVQVMRVKNAPEATHDVLEQFYSFIDDYRANPKNLRSFVLVLDDEKTLDFEHYENVFWEFLSRLSILDKKQFPHDARVSDDPQHPNFSYSIKSEAFFILGLHPKSPRFARRFVKPAIVFNLHQQFEQMRTKGVFIQVRNLIRLKDKILQGSINPMLKDFGESSEIFQYLGKVYQSSLELNLQKGFFYGSH